MLDLTLSFPKLGSLSCLHIPTEAALGPSSKCPAKAFSSIGCLAEKHMEVTSHGQVRAMMWRLSSHQVEDKTRDPKMPGDGPFPQGSLPVSKKLQTTTITDQTPMD